jgi:hypothetical protein
MGWLDKTFKNVIKKAASPEGIMLLSAAAPWLSAGMKGTGFLANIGRAQGAGKYASMFASGYDKLAPVLKSPWVSNALKNAAIQGGIATLTGSKHPWKAMGYAALGSMPFTAMQSAQAANAFNVKHGLEGKDAAKWYDFALGKDKIIPGDISQSFEFDTRTIDDPSFTPTTAELASGNYEVPQIEMSMGPPKVSTYFGPDKTFENLGDSMSYFTNPEKTAAFADNTGLAGLTSSITGDLDLMAATVPQIAGMYGGRMTDEEKWLASQEKQIRMWAFQFGIPYEEAKEIFADGYRNPYYQTQGPEDYGDFVFNQGGNMKYKDDYLSGGKAVGPGTGTSDSIRPVALSDGEFVFTEEATNNFPGGVEGLYAVMNSLDPNSEKPHEAREAIV